MRIALATVGTTGDVRPFAILARDLAEHGHEVTAVTWPVHRAMLEQPGVRVEVAGSHTDPTRIAEVAAAAAGQKPMEQVATLREFHLEDGAEHYRQLRNLLPGHDLVVLHGIHVLAHAVVLDERLRWATAVFDPVLLPTSAAPPAGMPNLGPANRVAWWALERALERLGRPVDAVLEGAGSGQRGLPLFRSRSPLLHIVACSPSIASVPPDLPAGAAFTGAWIDRSEPGPLPPAVEAFLAAGPPPIVITFGSMRGVRPDVLQGAVSQLVDGGRRVVVQGAVPDLGSSVLRVDEIDHRALFPRAELVVHHGGAGTTHAVVGAGVPSVVVPQIGDQPYWAGRLHRLGVAAAPIPVRSVSSRRLADAVIETADRRSLRAAATVLGERVRAEDGVAASRTLIERASSGS